MREFRKSAPFSPSLSFCVFVFFRLCVRKLRDSAEKRERRSEEQPQLWVERRVVEFAMRKADDRSRPSLLSLSLSRSPSLSFLHDYTAHETAYTHTHTHAQREEYSTSIEIHCVSGVFVVCQGFIPFSFFFFFVFGILGNRLISSATPL
jgi:hypothetical protein